MGRVVAAAAVQASPAPTYSAPRLPKLPSRLPVASLDPAGFDPFVGMQAPLPAVLTPTVNIAPVTVAPPPVQQQPGAPPLTYRYLGQMTDPAGVQQVYLASGDIAVPVAAGTRLEEGYVVESVGPAGVRLHYPPLNAHAVIPVPPVQDPTPR